MYKKGNIIEQEWQKGFLRCFNIYKLEYFARLSIIFISFFLIMT